MTSTEIFGMTPSATEAEHDTIIQSAESATELLRDSKKTEVSTADIFVAVSLG